MAFTELAQAKGAFLGAIVEDVVALFDAVSDGNTVVAQRLRARLLPLGLRVEVRTEVRRPGDLTLPPGKWKTTELWRAAGRARRQPRAQ